MVNPKWNGPIAMAFAMVATAVYMTHEYGCSTDSKNENEASAPRPAVGPRPSSRPAAPVASGGWCAGSACEPTQSMCESARMRLESPPACERVTERWCAGSVCFRWEDDCTRWRDREVRLGSAVEVCKLTPWR